MQQERATYRYFDYCVSEYCYYYDYYDYYDYSDYYAYYD